MIYYDISSLVLEIKNRGSYRSRAAIIHDCRDGRMPGAIKAQRRNTASSRGIWLIPADVIDDYILGLRNRPHGRRKDAKSGLREASQQVRPGYITVGRMIRILADRDISWDRSTICRDCKRGALPSVRDSWPNRWLIRVDAIEDYIEKTIARKEMSRRLSDAEHERQICRDFNH